MLIELNQKLKNINLKSKKEIIKKQINFLEKQIDNIVYDLYGLNKEEQEVIENS